MTSPRLLQKRIAFANQLMQEYSSFIMGVPLKNTGNGKNKNKEDLHKLSK